MSWMRFKSLYFFVSAFALALSLYAIIFWGFKPSIDFTGGTAVDYRFESKVDSDAFREAAEPHGAQEISALSANTFQLRLGPVDQKAAEVLADSLEEALGQRPEIIKFETVGPTLSQEILHKTYIAVFIIALGILFLIAWQFKSFKFGVFAIAALVHDLVILLGIFSYLGRFHAVAVDVLVVTAFLTTLSLSLYDTVIVYDRIREQLKRFSGTPFVDIANRAVTGTIVRSLNTSLTTSFVLLALFLIGGASIKWFVFALLIGVITGTYSSPFVAVPLLVVWDKLRSS